MPRKRTSTPTFSDAEMDELDGMPGLPDPDPEPAATRTRRRPAAKAPAKARPRPSRATSKTAARNKVRDEIVLYLSLPAAAWELRDPYCAAEATPERIGAAADAIADMIARSDTLLETVSKSGILGEIARLAYALAPIGRAIWRNHGPAGLGHAPVEEVQRDYAHQYPAWTPNGAH